MKFCIMNTLFTFEPDESLSPDLGCFALSGWLVPHTQTHTDTHTHTHTHTHNSNLKEGPKPKWSLNSSKYVFILNIICTLKQKRNSRKSINTVHNFVASLNLINLHGLSPCVKRFPTDHTSFECLKGQWFLFFGLYWTFSCSHLPCPLQN